MISISYKSISQRMFAITALLFASSGLVMFAGVENASGMTTGDAANGKILFERRCTGCHALDRNKEGPRLSGVFGRKAGTAPDFQYSDALKAADFVWDADKLEKWLTDTESVVPNNDMTFHVPKAQERADIIEYLRVTSEK